MADKKPFRGIELNTCQFQGTILKDPIVNGGFTFMTLRTQLLKRDGNGQFTKMDQDIPLMIEPDDRNASVVERFVKAGRQLHVVCSYMSWEAGGAQHHGFIVKQLDLGSKPYEGPSENSGPPLPQ